MNDTASSKRYWDRAAEDNAAWYTAPGHVSATDAYFATGERDVDGFLATTGVALLPHQVVLEIGSGAGRMTRRLSERATKVIAADVSAVMLERARENLNGVDNVEFVELPGTGQIPLPDASVDGVLSYITMQYIASRRIQDRYFAEALRVVKPGGWVLLQFRRASMKSRLLALRGDAVHAVRGRRTLSRHWRGASMIESTLRAHRTEDIHVNVLRIGPRAIWAVATRGMSVQ